jgi:hypothetical protein
MYFPSRIITNAWPVENHKVNFIYIAFNVQTFKLLHIIGLSKGFAILHYLKRCTGISAQLICAFALKLNICNLISHDPFLK